MSFAKKPTESKSEINRAGKILASPNLFDTPLVDWQEAIALAEKWRACHAYPINTFQATLRNRLKKFSGQPIAAQRLKRMPTIINKLRRPRHKDMDLTRMHDIGGVRAVVDTMTDVNDLVSQYKDRTRFAHQMVKEYDYIQNPRDEDGYRSVHLIYKYKNKVVPDYDNLLLELQIRTKLQHLWATAVETMGTYLEQPLKAREGDKEWIDFFATASSAFACIEGTNPLPKHRMYSKEWIFRAVSSANKDLRVLEKMDGYSQAVQHVTTHKGDPTIWTYHLIVLDLQARTIEIKSYKRGSIKQAITDYEAYEARFASGGTAEAVLVSAGPLATLQQAFPNFFLDVSEFTALIRKIIRESGE